MGKRDDGKPISKYEGSWADRINKEPLPKSPTRKVLALGTCDADGSSFKPYDAPVEREVPDTRTGSYLWLDRK